MSEMLEKVRGVKFLPLFPLPVVLMPFEIMPLHIFEPRYRQMLKDAQIGNKLFGLSYFDGQNASSTAPEIGSIGCVAEIRDVQAMEDGRSNILTVGIIRYLLEEIIQADEPYMVGEVSYFEDDEENTDEIAPLADEVFAMFIRIAGAAHELSGERGRFPDISQAEPQQLSFLVAASFSLDTEIKYELLQMRSTTKRLEKLREMLKPMVANIEERADINKIAKTNGHSKKKINL
jgi:Lon protease-like protein